MEGADPISPIGPCKGVKLRGAAESRRPETLRYKSSVELPHSKEVREQDKPGTYRKDGGEADSSSDADRILARNNSARCWREWSCSGLAKMDGGTMMCAA